MSDMSRSQSKKWTRCTSTADLTMGWCIDCHRETDVTMEGNGYYERIHDDLVEKHKEEGLESFKVEHIGGLESALSVTIN